jgi:tetratricopeptide (TPR) repeat protein
LGKYVEAEPLFKLSLPIIKRFLGEDHPDYATSLNNIAILYERMYNYTQAEVLYKEVLAIREKFLGEDYSDYTTSLKRSGRFCMKAWAIIHKQSRCTNKH